MVTINQPPLSDTRFLKSDQVRRMLGYSDSAAFWRAIREAGIPFVKITARRFMFEEAAVRAWLDSRTVGGPR